MLSSLRMLSTVIALGGVFVPSIVTAQVCHWPLPGDTKSQIQRPIPKSVVSLFDRAKLGSANECSKLVDGYIVPTKSDCIWRDGNTIMVSRILDDRYHYKEIRQALRENHPDFSFYNYEKPMEINVEDNLFKNANRNWSFVYVSMINALGQNNRYHSENRISGPTRLLYTFFDYTNYVSEYEQCIGAAESRGTPKI